MSKLTPLIAKLLLVLLLGLVMGSDMECNYDDGKLDIDFDRVVNPQE